MKHFITMCYSALEQHKYDMLETDQFLDRVEEVYGNYSAYPSDEGSFQKGKV